LKFGKRFMPFAPDSTIHRLSAPLVLACGVLSTMPMLKAGDIQILELLQAARLPVTLLLFIYSGWRIHRQGLWREHGRNYLAFLAISLALAIVSLRLEFFPPPDFSLLKQPLFISIARIGELFLAMYFMLAIAATLRTHPTLMRLSMDVYWICGAVSAVLSLASAALMKLTGVGTYFVYGEDLRVRGFFNEAGPYGIFLVSVALVLLLRARIFPDGPDGLRLVRHLSLGVVLVTLIQSSSKAGFFAVAGLCGLAGLVVARPRQRIALLAAFAVVCGLTWTLLGTQLLNYASDYSDFEGAVASRPDDPGLIMGRIMATILVPRMISAHPISGIGIGNYSLMRNDPSYLQGLPAVAEWDLPGLGLAGLTAELGIPLALYLVFLFLRPVRHVKQSKSPWILLMTAAFQPMAVLLGVNLNFFYPWLTTAFVLALLPPHSQSAVF
jgi:hypothetical protein